ncbi:hypothetical protein PHYBOEH_007434 [Phytophthora boehmeriae]|uniref:Uncharacterized protein n=1 Tax=Phytophthora boehmeriae TaxID=109152 RepID=A0A8T1W885_9STRA|nr:hypothetical protein PHYBOEH_007434 [Phytophthora boehmeriae]
MQSILLFFATVFAILASRAVDAVSLTLWTYKGAKTSIMEFKIPSKLPANTKIAFFDNSYCLSAGVIYSSTKAGSENFTKKFKMRSFMLFDNALGMDNWKYKDVCGEDGLKITSSK